MPSLILRSPRGDRIACRLDVRRRWTVGSHPACALRLPLPGVSSFHCEILLAGGRWIVRHLHGERETRVNGRTAVERPLADRDVISAGSARLEFLVDPRPEASAAPSFPQGSAFRRSSAARRPRRRPRPRAPLGGTGVALAAAAALSLLGVAYLARGSGRADGLPTPPSSVEASPAVSAGDAVEADPPVAIGRPPAEPDEPAAAEESPEGALTVRASEPEIPPGAEPPAFSFVRGIGTNEPSAVEADAGTAPDAAPRAEPEAGAEPAKPRRERASAEPVLSDPAIEAAKRAALIELAALDPVRAKSTLDDARRRGAPAERIADLEAEVAGMERARGALAAGVAKAVRSKTAIRLGAASTVLSFSPEGTSPVRLEPSLPLTISAGDAASVELADARGRQVGRFRLTSLPDELLFRLVSADGRPSAGTLRDLATLLRHGEGPARALASEGGGDPPPASGAEADPDEVSAWLLRKAIVVSRSRAALARGGAGAPDPSLLAAEAVSAWVAAKAARVEGKAADRLRDDLVAIREATLPLASLFRASIVEETSDGRARLLYKLSSEKAALEQAADLRPVGEASKMPRFANGGLVLEGEYRLAAGNPFVERVSVRGKARPLAPDAPNVNIVLWTHETDAVSPVDGEEQNWFMMLRKDPGTPSDWFVFGIGYRAVTWNMLEKKLEQVVLAGNGDAVKLPALVVLAGARGSTLHRDRGECLFAEPVAAGSLRRVEFSIDWDQKDVVWTVGKRRIVLGEGSQKARFAAAAPRAGSVGLLTNGRQVALEELEVVASLDAAWAKERRREMATLELKRAEELAKP